MMTLLGHDGLPPHSAFQRGMFVLDPEQSLAACEAVQADLERHLGRVDPAEAWCPQEAWMRAHGERN